MRTPGKLGRRGASAWRFAASVIEGRGADPESFRDAIELYAKAQDTLAVLEGEWEALGRPVLAQGGATGRADVPHPLVGMIAVARRDASKLGAALGLDPVSAPRTVKRSPGGQNGRVVAADRRAALTPTRLKAVT